jgi:hypothetical protein
VWVSIYIYVQVGGIYHLISQDREREREEERGHDIKYRTSARQLGFRDPVDAPFSSEGDYATPVRVGQSTRGWCEIEIVIDQKLVRQETSTVNEVGVRSR